MKQNYKFIKNELLHRYFSRVVILQLYREAIFLQQL